MPKKKKFGRTPTNLYNVYVNDSRKSFDFTMNRMYDMLEEHTYYEEKTQFKAKIISGIETAGTSKSQNDVGQVNNSGVTSVSLKIRFTDIDAGYNIFDDPASTDNLQERRQLVDLHPEAVLQLSDDNEKLPPYGSIVDVRKEGTKYFIDKVLKNGSDAPPRRGSARSASKSFGGGGAKSFLDYLRSLGGKTSTGKELKDAPNLSWDTLKDLADSKVFQPILDEIARYESGADAYNAWNYAGGFAKGTNKLMIEKYGKKPSELTIEKILTEVQIKKEFYFKGRNQPGKPVIPESTTGAFAIGKYQIIPSTLQQAFSEIYGCNMAEPFGELQQEALGIYLLTMKQPPLGRYLMGNGNVTIGQAQTSMASEWAGVRLSERAYRTNKRPHMWLKPGQSFYAYVGNNPTDINLKKASDTKKILEDAQKQIALDPNLKEILDRNEKMRSRRKKLGNIQKQVEQNLATSKKYYQNKFDQAKKYLNAAKKMTQVAPKGDGNE